MYATDNCFTNSLLIVRNNNINSISFTTQDMKNTMIVPFLTVNNANKAVDFYIAAFAAKETTRHYSPAGKLTARIDIEGAFFWVGDEEPEFNNPGPDIHGHSPVRIILITEKADLFYSNAIASGAIQICPMTTEEEWRIGKLKDPFGHTWEIGYTL